MPATAPVESNIVAQNEALKLLIALPTGDAIGAAAAFMLHCAHNHRVQFRRVMNEKVIHEGFSGISLLDLFKRVCR